MVVRLVRAGVGALLLLIAVPLALAGGGLWVAMEHRAADDTFTARLERLRSGGRAVVVPDIDALLRADAPFARGGQTTLNLSAVGSSGPLFIGLAPDTAVQRYLDGLVQARVSRVRLARGPLPVEFTEIETRAAAASVGRPGAGTQGAGPVQGGGPAVAGPGIDPGSGAGTAAPGTAGTGDPNASNPDATTADPGASNADPGATNADPDATNADPGAAAGDPNTTPADPNAPADPNTIPGDPSATDPNAVNPSAGDPNAAGAAFSVPAGQEFWLAKSIAVDGVAQLTWSPSALRGRHLALVVMNADGTAGINATVTARLAPAWIGPTAGGLLMLGTALFLLALLILAWPQRRAEARLVLPALPTQPTKSRLSLRRTLSDPIAALLNPVVPKNRDAEPAVAIAVTCQTDVEDDRQTTTVGVVVTDERATAVVTDESSTGVVVTGESATGVVVTGESATGVVMTGESAPVATGESAAVVTGGNAAVVTGECVAVATGDSAAVVTKESAGEPATAEVGVPEPQEANDQTGPAQGTALAESELDRPAPEAGIDDGPGPLALPPLPKLPAIELQFTWAPVAVDERVDEPAGERPGERVGEQQKAATTR
ncbi:hypothetical protein ACFO1B_07620 [Dactylosporangium siamense]|uniref:Uncharacterized protein n=1 Tax=Dactylosporangium siamense TaxID=685454 RepID=A0A919U9C9_9ACTN|nr:hypothetical protein [Dactylosporangium siamense]GIG43630.1 hypothetical protein Dsi01nite_016710 [Dactylosporangium siamense]